MFRLAYSVILDAGRGGFLQHKRNNMKNELITSILVLVLATFVLLAWDRNQSEYELNLIDQNTIELKSNRTGNVYLTDPDSLAHYLEIDNL